MATDIENMCINVSDDTDKWNRVALALCRDERRSFPELLRVKSKLSELLARYENETRDLERINDILTEQIKESDEQGHGA